MNKKRSCFPIKVLVVNVRFEIDLDIKDALFLTTILENSELCHHFGDSPIEGIIVQREIIEQIIAQICKGKNGHWRKRYKTNLNLVTNDLNGFAKRFDSVRKTFTESERTS